MKEYHSMNGVTTPDMVKQHLFDESKFENKLNLACGKDYMEGWTNLDGNPNEFADVHCDLDDPYLLLPFPNQEFDLIYAAHIFEHIINLRPLKRELFRILKPKGTLVVLVPEYTSPDAWGDDTHVRAFSIHAFMTDYWPKSDGIKVWKLDGKDPLGNPTLWLGAIIQKGES